MPRRYYRIWPRPAPRYREEDDDQANVQASQIFCCRDCRRLVLPGHNCDPMCESCNIHFAPKTGCPDLCNAIPCCGCCVKKPTTPPTVDTTSTAPSPVVFSLDELPVLNVGFQSHIYQAYTTNTVLVSKIVFPELKPIMHALFNFIISDRTLPVDFARAPYKTVFKAVGGKDAFIDMVYDTVLLEVKALQGRVITVEM